MDIDMEELCGERNENTKHIGAEEDLSYVAVPHMRDSHLDYQ